MNEKERREEDFTSSLVELISNLLKRNYVLELNGVEIKAEKLIISRLERSE